MNLCSLSDKGLEAFARAFENGAAPHLMTLDFAANPVGDAGLNVLTTSFSRGAPPTLRQLDITGAMVSAEGLRTLAAALAGGKLPLFARLSVSEGHMEQAARQIFASARPDLWIHSLQTPRIPWHRRWESPYQRCR